MARRKDPDYVSGEPGRFEISVPIVHPAHCVCVLCPRHRGPEDWNCEFTIRSRRKSPFPHERRRSSAYAFQLKWETEARLRDDVRIAIQRREALDTSVSLGDVADAYAEYLQTEGKRYDRDRYRIEAIVGHFGAGCDPAAITKSEYRAWCEHLGREGKSPATILRATNTLLAILNGARKDDLIREHQLSALRKPRVRTTKRPVTFSRRQVALLLGPALDEWERRQARRAAEGSVKGRFAGGSTVPLRGLCLVAYYTLMRPENNFALTWGQLWLDPVEDRGSFRLDEHKNAAKGVDVEGALHPELVKYLRPLQGRGLVHPNPETGEAYANIRAAWRELVEIANGMLGDDEKLSGKCAEFYTWRHTGASHLAESSGNPVLVARMMGDTSLRTVMNHYFDTSLEHMAEMVERWARPRIE